MITTNQEYRNENQHRQYPFLDDATLVTATAVRLPADFFVDALLYPIDLENALYLQSIDYNTKTITFADTVTGKVHGVAVWEDDKDTAYVYEPAAPQRQTGVLVLGPGRFGQSVGGTLTFAPTAATLAPAAYYSLNQPAVRGIRLEDGTYYTGALVLEGSNGVEVYSYVDDAGRSIVEFNVSGITYDFPECFECRVVECLKIVTNNGSFLVPSACAPNMACITSVFKLDDVCPPTNISLPSKRKDPCADPTICSDLTGAAGDEFYICPTAGRVYLVAPSPTDYANPLVIDAESEPAPPPDYNAVIKPKGLSVEERQRILTRMFDRAAQTRGRISIQYRGLTTGRHY